MIAMDKFTYLGSTLSCTIHIDDETDTRIAKANFSYVKVVRGELGQ